MESNRRLPVRVPSAVITQGSEVTAIGEHAVGAEISLLVMDERGLARYPLPRQGTVRIGRGREADVRLSDPLASRQHLLLHVDEFLAVEDTGSGNGTRVRGEVVPAWQRVRIDVGEAVKVGGTVLMAHWSRPQVAKGSAEPEVYLSHLPRGAVVVCDPAMRELHALVARVAAGNINVLVLGETGVGKDVVAEALHHASPRRRMPFLRLNCAALSEALLESELFGHEQGAFTGATHAKPGLLEAANGGTVFLDEVGELPPVIQAKLLRVIEARELTRVGGLKVRSLDVRFVSATNRNLEDDVRIGKFREDLYFRLEGFALTVPPLRDRPSEIEPLADMLIAEAARGLGLGTKPELSGEALALLKAHAWPGNVRELRNALQRATLLCGGLLIAPEHLPFARPSGSILHELKRDTDASSKETVPTGDAPAQRGSRDQHERQRILDALQMFVGNQTRAAAYLGIPRRTFVAKLAHYDVPRPRKNTPLPDTHGDLATCHARPRLSIPTNSR